MPTPSRKKRESDIEKRRRPLPSFAPAIRSRHEQLIDGSLPVSELSMDELRLGRGALEDGTFTPGRPKAVPQAIQAAIGREFRNRLLSEFNRYGPDAIETISEVMYAGEGAQTSHGTKEGTKRLDAAKYIIERIVGPIPTRSEVTTEVTIWQGLQESGELFVDIETEEIHDAPETRQPERRKIGPRTRPMRTES
jgi:hypothetical protein